jgi:hypothetical protein
MPDKALTARNVVFEFIGGPHDGLVVRDVINHDYDEAAGLLWQTDGGRPGAEFWMPSEYALEALRTFGLECAEQLAYSGQRFPVHWYQVIVRWVRQDALVIRVKHFGSTE